MEKSKLHHHGIDCCWECFHGRDSHPDNPNNEPDYACFREFTEFPNAVPNCKAVVLGSPEVYRELRDGEI